MPPRHAGAEVTEMNPTNETEASVDKLHQAIEHHQAYASRRDEDREIEWISIDV
jgi:hypothetical protein